MIRMSFAEPWCWRLGHMWKEVDDLTHSLPTAATWWVNIWLDSAVSMTPVHQGDQDNNWCNLPYYILNDRGEALLFQLPTSAFHFLSYTFLRGHVQCLARANKQLHFFPLSLWFSAICLIEEKNFKNFLSIVRLWEENCFLKVVINIPVLARFLWLQ